MSCLETLSPVLSIDENADGGCRYGGKRKSRRRV